MGTAALGCPVEHSSTCSWLLAKVGHPTHRKAEGICLYSRTILVLAWAFLSVGLAHARVHRSQAWAETQWAKAEAQRETLNGHAEQARTRREYETVIASYRRIVLEAPTTSKADGSAFAVAELTAEMGRHFKDEMALYSAVREYKFLRREYPGSKHRIQALLAIGEIYKNDLNDDSDARAALEELLRRYPNSQLAKEARSELATTANDAGRESEAAKSSDSESDSDQQNSDNDEQAVKPAAAPPASDTNSDQLVRATDVRYWSAPDYTRVTVELQQDVQFNSQRISHPDRIFFDLKNTRLASHLRGQNLDVNDGLVKRVRVAQYDRGKARIVIETEGHAAYNASLVLNPPRLVIDVHADDPDARERRLALASADAGVSTRSKDGHTYKAQRKPASNTKDVAPLDSALLTAPEKQQVAAAAHDAVKKVVVEADDDDGPDAAAPDSDKPTVRRSTKSSARESRPRVASKSARESQPTADGDRSLIRALGLKIGKIVIDPGHGGHDTGTIGPNGLYEKDLVLDVSRRLGKLLQSRLGAEVVFTRRDDTFIPLETRTAIANQEQADLFVSVHANSSHDPDARGVETYYLNFTSSPDALEVAARENAASDKSIHELQDLVKTIALKEKIEESREFAADVQQSLHSGLALKNPGERDRGVKKAPFVVLIGANMPSILAEISFISNPGDERRLKSPEYRQRIAECLYRGISRYVNGLGGVKMATRMEKASAE